MKFFSLLVAATVLYSAALRAETPTSVSVTKIWDVAGHNAFTDLIWFNEKWFCTFREADGHVRGNGKIRVLASENGERWESAALMEEDGIDLRDPKLSITPDNRLMMVLGGSVYRDKKLIERQSRVAFSADGHKWAAPQRVLEKGDWLWRVTWHDGHAYGIPYNGARNTEDGKPRDWTVALVESKDGVDFRVVTKLEVPGRPNEATVRFLANGDCVALVRREGDGLLGEPAWIGISPKPYQKWSWHPAGMAVGGPNFIVLKDGSMIASGRQYNPKPTGPKTFVGRMTLDSVTADLVLPSGGDCSYPGMVWHDGLLWLTYYSSHEGKAAIYLAKVRLSEGKPSKN